MRFEREKVAVGCAADELAVFDRGAAIWGEDFFGARLPDVFPTKVAIGGIDRDRVMRGGEVQDAIIDKRT